MGSGQWGVAVSLLVAVVGVPAPARGAEPFPGDTLGVEIGSGLPANYEPSGSAWHPRLQQVFLVSDGGRVSRLNGDGSGIVNWTLAGNWEGIAVADPASDFVYLVNENSAVVREFNHATGAGGRSFDLSTASAAPGVMPLSAADLDALRDNGDSQGIEALTFVPDPADPQGGAFWAGSQENGFIYRFAFTLAGGTGVTYLGKFSPGQGGLQGLEYDWERRVVYALSPAHVTAISTSLAVIRDWNPPAGGGKEGVACDGGNLYIAFDPAANHSVKRYGNFDPGFGPPIGDAMFADGFE